MLQKQTLVFLAGLKKNNNKIWFDKNRNSYEVAKKNFQEFVDALIPQLVKFDTALTGLEGKSCLFRINRDIRFSKNKSPYKTNFGASIKPGGKKTHLPGYYIHIEKDLAFLAGGVWMPEVPQLNAIRQEIDYNYKEFMKIINNQKFKKYFKTLSKDEKLVNPPKGYAKDNPAIEILKLKSFVVYAELDASEVLSKGFLKKCIEIFKAMYALNLFLRRAMD